MGAQQISRRIFLQGAAASVVTSRARAGAGVAYSPAAFAASAGVNTHLSSEPYASQYMTVRELLRASGIRTVRDELRRGNDLNRWRDLHDSFGIRSHLLVSPATSTVAEMLSYIEALGVERVSAIEGQNEGDSDWFKSNAASGGNWSKTVVDYQRSMFQALRTRYPSDALPIVSPTVLDWKPADMRQLIAAANFCDAVAIHSYAQHAEEPETGAGYAALSWYLHNLRDVFKPGAPVMATETGYNTMSPPAGSAISEAAAAIYLPRLLLNNFAEGVQRTFIYELMDGGADPANPEHHWGLVRHDGTPKPAFNAIATLLGAMTDQTRSVGAMKPVTVRLREAPPKTKSLEFRKGDGSTIVAIWRAEPCWDRASAADVEVPPVEVLAVPDRPISAASLMVPNDGSAWTDLAPSRGGGLAVPVSGKVVLLRLA
jgi:hypothetical protein